MRLSLSIPLVTGFVLVLTVSVNIVGLGVFINELFPVYVSSVSEEINSLKTPDPNLLKSFIQANSLDASTRKEYEAIIGDLQQFTENLSDISRNPESYIGSGMPYIGIASEGGRVDNQNKNTLLAGLRLIAELFGNMRHSIGSMSLEEKFIRDILMRIVLLNSVWIVCIFFIYYIWIRRLFRPIQTVTENLQSIVQKRKYTNIPYVKHDEFRPLTEMINTLSKSLSQQEKIRSDFLSDLSHEIRTPITTVRCYLEGLHDGVIEANNDTLKLLDRELVRLTEITGRIMEYERLSGTSGEQRHGVQFLPFDSIKSVMEEYSPQLHKTHQQVEILFSEHTHIMMDNGMFLQILHNIFSNFLKYAGNKTTLSIDIIREKKSFTLVFCDNGQGVPESEIPYIGERFYRVDKARTSTDGSMGIGLSIIDKIAHLHGGSMQIANRVGGGLVVKVKIIG